MNNFILLIISNANVADINLALISAMHWRFEYISIKLSKTFDRIPHFDYLVSRISGLQTKIVMKGNF
jgi:hypothetical protein